MAERNNLASLGLIQGLRLAAGLAVNVLIMRSLGVDGYGVYGYVVTLVGLLSFGANMGMGRLLQREIARDHASAGPRVATGLATGVLLSIVTSVVIVGWAVVSDGRPVVVMASALGALAVGGQALVTVTVSVFHATRRVRLGVPGMVAGRLILVLGTVVLVVGYQFGVVGVFVAQVLDAFVTLSIVGAICWRELDTSTLKTSWADVRALVVEAFPFGMNALFGSIYLSVDVLLLAHMRGDTEVGIYRGAVLLIALFPVLADTFTTGVYPRMATWVGKPDEAGRELRFVGRVLLAISVPAMVGGVLVAEPLMVFVGGSDFARSALPFLIMAPMLPLRFINNGVGMTLSALDRQGDRTRGVMLAAALNLGANILVIPQWGAAGAAATTLLTEVCLAIWFHWRVRPLVVDVGLVGSLGRALLPALVMGGVILLLPPIHVTLVIAIGILVYAIGAFATRAVRRDDLARLRRV